ncbi:MAG: phenylalanine--tRNA ligase subunit alpha [Candidatus Nanohaloarchaeota archaeon QJJ-7]|nr:phenylalanine--tRNA ligase subunit alpha [Candidatus Nanohaloarchaeota archaeon QJJ-7]
MELHPQAQELLMELKEQGEGGVQELEEETGIPNVMRPAQWLEEEELVEIEEEKTVSYKITEVGKDTLKNGLPEEKVLEKVEGGETSVEDIQGLGEVAELGIGKAREKGLIEIEEGVLYLTEKGEQMLGEEHEELEALERVKDGEHIEDDIASMIRDRGLVQEEETVSRRLIITEKGEDLDLSEVEEEFNVELPAKDALVGRKHFAREVYDYIRRVWVEMGFQEMNGSLVVPSLLNFDALYTPQDHPARELHDTFFMEEPEKSDIEDYGSSVDWIRETHEDGWEAGSDGWDYTWNAEEARKNVLRTHTTSVSAQTLWELSEDDLPAKFFAVGRNFRNETVDWKHLAEFFQTEGIVVAEDANFRNLLGYLKQFFSKLGFDKVRFRPAYYPYTELSIEMDVYDEKREEWIGLGGAGMFRPEVVKPLLGFEVPVLAWGPGVDRMVMRNHDIDNIRELYRNDLELLRDAEAWVR